MSNAAAVTDAAVGAVGSIADVFAGRARCAITLGDALDFAEAIPDGSVRAVVIDPPYCSGGRHESQRKGAKGQGLRSETLRAGRTAAREAKFEAARAAECEAVGGVPRGPDDHDSRLWFANDDMSTVGLVWLLRSVAVESRRVLEDGGSLLVFADPKMVPALVPPLESSGLRWVNTVAWHKGNPGLGRGFRPAREDVLHFTKGVGVYYSDSGSNVLRAKRITAHDREHPTQKPVDLLDQLLEVVAGRGDRGGRRRPVVVDFFCGSSSTGVAALARGLSYLGNDADEAHVATSLARCADALGAPRECAGGQRTMGLAAAEGPAGDDGGVDNGSAQEGERA